MNEGYAICLNEWALDKDIKNELGLLLIISSLCAEKGFCYASNKYLSELFEISEETVSRKLKTLEDKKYITIEYKKRGCEILERNIRLTKISIDDYQKYQSTIDENVKENNTSINNTSKESISKDIPKKVEIKYFESLKVNTIFNEFLELRKKIKAVNSERAIKTLVNKLNNYDEDTQYKMIEKSIVNSWKDVYELKDFGRKRKDSVLETLQRMYNENE